MTEAWLPVPGYEGIYEVSDIGNVRSLDRVDSRGWHRRGRPFKAQINRKTKRLQVRLHKNGRGHTLNVHRLVAQAFVPGEAPGLLALHSDGNALNNTPGNLYWGTYSQNAIDRENHRREAACISPGSTRA
ncbi:MAG: NUMOD4 domain-containing protein [Armatimonadia bacterium]